MELKNINRQVTYKEAFERLMNLEMQVKTAEGPLCLCQGPQSFKVWQFQV